METTPPQRDDYDSPWKEALEQLFPEFLALLFPAIHAAIDWRQGHTFLDKELQQVVRDAELGRRFADKLARVHTREGRESWVLIHVEVQGAPEAGFGERMYIYNYRLFDRHRVDIISLAVLTDARPGFRAGRYRRGRWGCETDFRFPAVKLLELARAADRLEASDNPFGLVVLAQIKARAHRDGPTRLRWKLHLIRLLLRRGYDRHRVLELLRLIDWLIRLPEALELELEYELKATEEPDMPYISTFERNAMRRGKQEGLLEGERAVLLRQLERKFGSALTEQHREKVRSADTETLLEWSEHVLTATTPDDVFSQGGGGG